MTAEQSPIWLKSYPSGMAQELRPLAFNNLTEFYDHSIDRFSARPAFSSLESELSYADIGHFSKKIAAWLQHNAADSNGNIGIMSPNILQYPILVQAIHRAGMTVVNINPLLTASELSQIICNGNISTIFAWNGACHTIDNIDVEAKKCLNNVVSMSLADHFTPIKKALINFVLNKIKKLVPNYSLADFNQVDYEQIKDNDLSFDKSMGENTDISSLAFLQYTGGTTGLPKGVKLSHANILSNLTQASQFLEHTLSKDNVVNVITALPMYHIFSLTANFFTMFAWGKRNILITNPRDIKKFIATLVKNPPHIMTGVDTLYNALAINPLIKKVDFSGLEVLLGGGMAVQKSTSEKWKTLTGKFILEAYGLSETSPAVTINPHTVEKFTGSIGIPIPGTQVQIIDDDENPLAVGEQGELVVKGPQVMSGYWQNQDETDKAFTQDKQWFKTGDIASMDENGFFYILDRKKDMVVVSGFNVYPTEVEQIINSIDGVVECGCIGVSDEHSDEVVKALIVTSKSLQKEDIIVHCKNHLSAYKVPKHIEFIETLPKTNIGKILKRDLK